MPITGLHLLLTYKCTYECDHCFVWGSPSASGTMTLAQIRQIYQQAQDLSTIRSVFFEGGEPFLYYPVLAKAVEEGRSRGWHVGVVSNGYWATAEEDALEWLRPLAAAGLSSIDVSSDLYHGSADDEMWTPEARWASAAAAELGLGWGTLTVETPPCNPAYPQREGDTLMYRGRAATELLEGVPVQAWDSFAECLHEDLLGPSRVHVDAFGYVHLCQGLTLGNLFEQPLVRLVAAYDPAQHPIVGPLLSGGPAELVRRYEVPHEPAYADACHLCYTTRERLRARFPEMLAPDQMYGVSQTG